MKKEIKKEELVKIIKIALVLALVLLIINFIINIFKDYSNIRLKTNNKEIFTISDLKVNNLNFGSTEKEIEKELGKPISEKKSVKNSYKYKQIKYKGLVLTLRENYDDYMLVGVDISSRNYKVGRDIKVGTNIEKVMKKFNIRNPKGKYLYGNYTLNALKQKEIKENIYFGLRTKKQVMYINRDSVIDKNTNTATLNLKYDKGKVSNIKWSYDFD